MSDFQQRVCNERAELLDRWVKLTAFLETEVYQGLLIDEQRRLVRQQHVMSIYLNILDERIAHFNS